MAIIQWALNQTIAPRRAPCGTKGAFTVTATVVAQTDKAGASYIARVKDEDFFTGHDLLDSTPFIRLRGAGWHIRQTVFKLDCNACIVSGARGNSGEQTAQIFCEAEEQGVILFARRITTNSIPVTCFTCKNSKKKSESLSEYQSTEGAASVQESIREVRLSCQGKVAKAPSGVTVCLPPPLPEYQIIPDEIDFTVFPLQVGIPTQRFRQPLTVGWRLSPQSLAKLKKFEGRFLRYNPKSFCWEVVDDFRLIGRTLSFTTRQGGLFGIAAGSRYRRYEGFESRTAEKDQPKQRRLKRA